MAEAARHIALKSAVGYVRCSTEMQEDSPDQQKKEILAFAERTGYRIVDWFVDFGKSGTTFEQRPEFMKLQTAVESNPTFGAVICYDESRWGRAIDAEENTYRRVLFRKCGIDVVLVKTSVDRNNDFAPMLAAFEGVQASQYSKKLSELTLRGSKNNGIYSNGGTAPYGYIRKAVNTKTGTERELKVGEWCIPGQEKVTWALGQSEEIKVIQFIFEKRADGMAAVLIAKALNDRGVSCSKRGRWRNKDQKWSGVTIDAIVKNPAYYGARRYNQNSMSKIQASQKGRPLRSKTSYPHWKNDPNEVLITENAHPPIVTKEVWDKANECHKTYPTRASNGYTHSSKYLLSGLIRCSRCGFAFYGCSAKADGKEYPKYVDGGWFGKRVCSHLGLRKEYLESFAIQSVKETISDPVFMRSIEEQLELLMEQQPSTIEDNRSRMERELEEVEGKLNNLTEAVEKGIASETVYRRFGELEEQKTRLQTALSQLNSRAPITIDKAEMRGRVEEYVRNFETNIHQAAIEERKMLMRRMISEIIVDRDAECVKFYVRRLPVVTPELENLLKNKRVPANFASTLSSGGRT